MLQAPEPTETAPRRGLAEGQTPGAWAVTGISGAVAIHLMAFANNKALVIQRPNPQNPNPYLQVGGKTENHYYNNHHISSASLLLIYVPAALPCTMQQLDQFSVKQPDVLHHPTCACRQIHREHLTTLQHCLTCPP